MSSLQNGRADPPKPTLEQQAAIISLENQQVTDILTYVRLTRCGKLLSNDQVFAVFILSECSDEELRTWLLRYRNSGMTSTSHNVAVFDSIC